jgi:small-conductance mechanosensitive channel
MTFPRCAHGLASGCVKVLIPASIAAGAVAAPRAMTAEPLPNVQAATDSVAAPLDSAVLAVRGRTIVVFRAPIGALSMAERAASAARRIEALAESESGDSVVTRPVTEGELVSVGSRGVFTITPADVDTLRGESLETLTSAAASRLRTALSAAREERSIPHLIRGAALALLATLVFLVALRLLRGARRLLFAKLPSVAETRIDHLDVGGFTLVSSEKLLLFTRRLIDLVTWSAGLFLAYLWLAFVLTRFAYTRPWGEALGTYLATTISELALTALRGIPGLFTVVVILVVTRWIARVVGAFFDAAEAGTVEVPWVHPETANPTKRISIALLWMFAIVVSYPYIPGSSSSVFKGVSVFAGLVLSLGSSGVVNQAMSGLVLMYSRALKPGDYVRIGDTEGIVTALGMLSTKIRTTRREMVTLPNAVVAGAAVMNYSRAQSELVLHTGVTIGYDTPWRQVEALLLMAAGRTEGLREEPAPYVLKTALSDFYIEYQLRAAPAHPEERVRILDRLHGHIVDCFNEYGVQIMSPHYEADPPAPAVVPPERWHAPPARTMAPVPPVPAVPNGDGSA